MFNEKLSDKLNISLENKERIKQIHKEIEAIFKHAETKYVPNLNKWLYHTENELQELWGFEKDPNKHTYWYKIPGCKCPILDNDERFGSPYKIYAVNCPYHGKKSC